MRRTGTRAPRTELAVLARRDSATGENKNPPTFAEGFLRFFSFTRGVTPCLSYEMLAVAVLQFLAELQPDAHLCNREGQTVLRLCHKTCWYVASSVRTGEPCRTR